MPKKSSVIVIFTIVYWLLAVGFAVLFSFCFGTIPVNNYGILQNFWSVNINPSSAYTSGVYYITPANSFHLFPTTLQYITYSKTSSNGVLKLISSDMQPFTLQYSLAYRILFSSLADTYTNYQYSNIDKLKTFINNEIMSILSSTPANQLWLSQTEDLIINSLISSATSNNFYGVQIYSFWLGDIQFMNLEEYYSKAYVYSYGTSANYQKNLYELSNTKIQISTLNQTLEQLKWNNKINLTNAVKNSYYTNSNFTANKGYFEQGLKNITNISSDPTLFTKFLTLRNSSAINFLF